MNHYLLCLIYDLEFDIINVIWGNTCQKTVIIMTFAYLYFYIYIIYLYSSLFTKKEIYFLLLKNLRK